MNLEFTICQVTFGNGAKIGMAVTAGALRQILRVQVAALAVSCVVVVGATMQGSAVYHFVITSVLAKI